MKRKNNPEKSGRRRKREKRGRGHGLLRKLERIVRENSVKVAEAKPKRR